jgi:hypothetical protein
MTIVNGIEIDNFEYKENNIKRAILSNTPIDDTLHVIAVISNPCAFARRYILMKEFIERFETEERHIQLYVVEMVYGKQKFIITKRNNDHHLQIRTKTPLWHKENMINLAVKHLLPPTWKAMAWIDSDLEFENVSWVQDSLRILNGECDIIQLFSHAVDMDPFGNAMSIFTSAGFQYSKQLPYTKSRMNYWHPGYAWACTRTAYETMGGLYDKGILGSGDNIMLLSLIQNGLKGLCEQSTDDYKSSVLAFQERVKSLRLGYVPGVIRHYYHGSKKNRRYMDRWMILRDASYQPSLHVTYDKKGVLVPTKSFPPNLGENIMKYFSERNEDEGLNSDGKYEHTEPPPLESDTITLYVPDA